MWVGGSGYFLLMEKDKHKNPELQDGRPVEVREGKVPQSKAEKQEDIPDTETVENIGY